MKISVVEYFTKVLGYPNMSPEIRDYIAAEKSDEIALEAVMKRTGLGKEHVSKTLGTFTGNNMPGIQKKMIYYLYIHGGEERITPPSVALAGGIAYSSIPNYLNWDFAEYMGLLKLGKKYPRQPVYADTPVKAYREVILGYYKDIDIWMDEIKSNGKGNKKGERAASSQRVNEALEILGKSSVSELTALEIDGLGRGDWRAIGSDIPASSLHNLRRDLKQKIKENSDANLPDSCGGIRQPQLA